jgi:hypothetical protein
VKQKNNPLLPLLPRTPTHAFTKSSSDDKTSNGFSSPKSISKTFSDSNDDKTSATNVLATSLNYQHDFAVTPVDPIPFNFDAHRQGKLVEKPVSVHASPTGSYFQSMRMISTDRTIVIRTPISSSPRQQSSPLEASARKSSPKSAMFRTQTRNEFNKYLHASFDNWLTSSNSKAVTHVSDDIIVSPKTKPIPSPHLDLNEDDMAIKAQKMLDELKLEEELKAKISPRRRIKRNSKKSIIPIDLNSEGNQLDNTDISVVNLEEDNIVAEF